MNAPALKPVMAPSAFANQRFGMLLHAHWHEYRSRYAAYLLMLAMLYILVLVFIFSTGSSEGLKRPVQQAIYYIGLIFTGLIFSASYFQAMGQRESALLILMRPASVFEKWLMAACWILVLYPLAYTLIFTLITWPASHFAFKLELLNYAKELHEAAQHKKNVDGAVKIPAPKFEAFQLFIPFTRLTLLNGTVQPAWAQLGWWLFYVGATGFVVTCSLYFKRAVVLRTAALAFAIWIVTLIIIVSTQANPAILGLWWSAEVDIPWPVHLANAAVWGIAPFLLWFSAYWNLRERELT